ncbi:MAG: ABC transporter permease [Clostridiales bacterium]|nr:ABC transporter permease [Clostridiales bacterium]
MRSKWSCMKLQNRRSRAIFLTVFGVVVILTILLAGNFQSATLYEANYKTKNLAPSLAHLFGTDYMGRDTFHRTLKGLSSSILIGMFASLLSSIMSIVVGLIAACGSRRVDRICLWLINCFMGVPGLLMLMLIAYSTGRGIRGVVLGVAVTHWPDLARVIRAEVMSVRGSQYVLAAEKMGRSRWQIAVQHIVPYVLPQFFVGLILMFPHAILHEAGITFLGYGLPLESPAIGAILSEAMQQISTGQWWLVFFPGLSLLLVVMLIDVIGENVRLMLNPYTVQE